MFKDIRKEEAPENESIFVDTNVWYWTTYFSSKEYLVDMPKDYQTEFYPNFIENALAKNTTLYFSPLVFVELSGLIEKAELKIYNKFHPENNMNLKQFRKIGPERRAVLNEIKIALDTIKGMAEELPLNFDIDMSETVYSCLDKYLIDGYDSIFYKKMKANNIDKILTDDKDFRSLPVTVYSCYEKV
ncbi:PIN domain-containing protein [Pseudoalteromonas distincta]|uniref:PIN domain-containing protein n=1 Tax=Pseudoalteromonas distincta TaxID=77608 RepID=UPI00352EFAEC